MLKWSLYQLIIFFMWIALLLCGSEVGIFYLLNWLITYWYITIITMILIHLMIARFVIPICLFEWKIFYVKNLHYYRSGRTRAVDFRKKLHSTKSLLQSNDLMSLSKNKQKYKLNIKVKKSKAYVKFYIEIFEHILSTHKKLSNQQVYLFKSLQALDDSFSTDDNINELPFRLIKSQNDIIDLTKKQKNIELIMNCAGIIRQLDDYSYEGQRGFSFKKLIKIFKEDLLSNHHISRAIFAQTYQYMIEEHQVKTKNSKIIDYVILKNVSGLSHSNKKPNLLIYSGPNGGPFELILKSSFIELFLTNGIDILHWNYRGYGYSTGTPTFANCKEDICSIYDEVIKLNRWNKIGAMGRSIGGIPSCYLAYHRKIDLLISDRNFSSIEALLNGFTFGNVIYWVYKSLFVSSSYTIEDYIKSNCYKILMYDPLDEIINGFGSLKSGVTQYVLKNNIKIKCINQEEEISSIKTDMSEEFLLKLRIQSTNVPNAFDNILDAVLIPKEKTVFVNSLLYYGEIIENKSYWDQFINTNNSIANNNNQSEVNDNISKTLRDILINFFNSFINSTMSLSSILRYKGNRRKKLFIELFFSDLFIWGCSEKNRDNIKLFSLNKVEEELKKAKMIIELLTSTLSSIKLETIPLYQKSLTVIETFKKLERSLHLIYAINTQKNLQSKNDSMIALDLVDSHKEKVSQVEDLTENLLSIGRGHIIKLSTGHNGPLKELELKNLLYHLEKAEFLNELNK